MSTATETIEGFVKQEYKYGFVTDVEAIPLHPDSTRISSG